MSNPVEDLHNAVELKKLRLCLPIYRSGQQRYLRWEVRDVPKKDSGHKVIDFEDVKKAERPEDAAGRMFKRLRKDGVV